MIRNFSNANKRMSLLLFLSLVCTGISLLAQRNVTIAGTIQGTTSGVLGTTTRYAVNESLYLDSELGAGNQNSTLTSLTIRTNAGFPAGTGTFNNVTIRVKEVAPTVTTLAAAVYNVAGYTTIFNGTINAPTTQVTDIVIPFSTPFPRTAGQNLMVMIERLDNSLAHTSGNWQVIAAGNATGPAMARRFTGNTAPVIGTTNISSLFLGRSVVGFTYSYSDPNLSIEHVYTLGKLPIPYGTPHIVQANIANNSLQTAYNVVAKITITGANNVQDSIIIDSIPKNSKRIVNFPPFNPSNYGLTTIKADVVPQGASQQPSAITTFSMDQTVTNNVYSLAYGFNGNPPVAAGGVGFTGATGDFIAKFYSDSPSKVNQVAVTFNGNPGQTFKMGIWGDSGSGTPGALLWESPQQTSVTGVFTVPVSPKVPVLGNFFVGVRQLGTTNIAFSYQAENPPRAGSYFYTSPTGNTNWVDFATSQSPFRFMVEPKLELANDVGVSQVTVPGTGLQIDRCGLVAPKATVTNYGIFDQIDVPVQMVITENGAPVYNETVTIPSLTSGQILTVTFPQTFNTGVAGTGLSNYSATCTTYLTGDQDNLNDGNTSNFSYGDFSYGQDNLTTYQFSNSSACAAAAPFQPTYNWITQTANEVTWSSTNADDLFAGPYTLPFPYNYYGVDYTQYWVSSNGFITFTDPTAWSVFNNGTALAIPAAGGIENYIAGAMDDLDFSPTKYPDAHVYYGPNPNNPDEYVITFWHAHKYYVNAPTPSEYLTFQIVLKRSGRFPFTINYNDVASLNPASIVNTCTIGFENATGNAGVQYRRLGSRGPLFDVNNGPLAFSARYLVDKSISLSAKVYLDDVNPTTGLMTVYLNSLSNFPISDPYAVAPFITRFPHVNSGALAATNPSVLAVTGPDAIVDWVMLELREGVAGATTVTASRAALLQSDGDIVDVDGISPVSFVGVSPGSYFIAVRHRNHLGFRTNDAVALSNAPTSLNFTDNSTLLNGSFPTYQKGLVYAMIGGDANFDGSVDAADTPTWESQNGLFDDYTNNADYNLDGSVDAVDTPIWESQNGKYEELD